MSTTVPEAAIELQRAAHGKPAARRRYSCQVHRTPEGEECKWCLVQGVLLIPVTDAVGGGC